MRLVWDRPGHACLAVVREMHVKELLENLRRLARRVELIGRIRVSPT